MQLAGIDATAAAAAAASLLRVVTLYVGLFRRAQISINNVLVYNDNKKGKKPRRVKSLGCRETLSI